MRNFIAGLIVGMLAMAFPLGMALRHGHSLSNISYKIKPGDVFYTRWGVYESIRRYRCVDTNKSGSFVKWLDAGGFDSHSIEFMPNDVVENPAFKLLDPDTTQWLSQHSEIGEVGK